MLERENRETLQELSAAREEVGALTEEVFYLYIQNCIFIIAILSLLSILLLMKILGPSLLRILLLMKILG